MDQFEPEFEDVDEGSWFGTALSLVIVIVVMVVAFVWFVIQFDPLTSDFIDSDPPVATATETPSEN